MSRPGHVPADVVVTKVRILSQGLKATGYTMGLILGCDLPVLLSFITRPIM